MKPSPLDHLPRRSLFAEDVTPAPINTSKPVNTPKPVNTLVETAAGDGRKTKRREYMRKVMADRRALSKAKAMVVLATDAEADAEIERQRQRLAAQSAASSAL